MSSPNHATTYLWPQGVHTNTHTYLHESDFKKTGAQRSQVWLNKGLLA